MIREYDVEITIHETGTVVVEAASAKEAMEYIRNGGGWDEFYSNGNPRVGVRSATPTETTLT